MSTVDTPVAPPQQQATEPERRLRIDRIVLGLGLAGVGVAWFLQGQGVEIDWKVVPPAALLVVGATLLITSMTGTVGRTPLIWLGAGLLVVSVALGFGAARYTAPTGNLVLTPTAQDWPSDTRLSAGNVRVDLTGQPLPASGRLEVHLGAGNATIVVPEGAALHLAATVGTGTIVVDGQRVSDGFDLAWSDGEASDPVVVTVDVALGQVEVQHD